MQCQSLEKISLEVKWGIDRAIQEQISGKPLVCSLSNQTNWMLIQVELVLIILRTSAITPINLMMKLNQSLKIINKSKRPGMEYEQLYNIFTFYLSTAWVNLNRQIISNN